MKIILIPTQDGLIVQFDEFGEITMFFKECIYYEKKIDGLNNIVIYDFDKPIAYFSEVSFTW